MYDFRTVVGFELFDIGIYAAAEGKMYAAFLLEYACFHAEKVVALAFFEIRIAAPEQKFPHFEIIVRVVFV